MTGRGGASAWGWVTVRVYPGAQREAVVAAMFEAGAMGVQELGDAIVTHVPGQSEADTLVTTVSAIGADVHVETEPLPDIDWSEQWKRGIRAQRVGALTIAPPWLADGLDPAIRLS